MDNNSLAWRLHGDAKIYDAWNSGGKVHLVFNEMGNLRTQEGKQAFAGAVEAGISILCALMRSGHLCIKDPIFDDGAKRFFRAMNDAQLAGDHATVHRLLQFEVDSLAAARQLLPYVRVTRPAPEAMEYDPEPLAVRVVELPAMTVNVASLPVRETSMEVTRDSAGNIKSTVQTERDAA
jgi:hypothetical protein